MFHAAITRPRRRTLLTLGVVVAAVGLLAGCTSTPSGTSTTSKVTLTLSMQQTDVKTGDPTTWGIVQAFEKKYPNITVTVTGQPVAQHDQSIDAAAQSNTLPDMFWVNSAVAGAQLAKSGALLDLTPIIKADGLESKFTKTALSDFKEGSIQYGLPYQGLLTGLYVNKKILADNGLKQPVTFDDLIADAKVLHAKGIVTIADGANQSAYSVWSFLTDLDRFGYDSKIQSILAGKSSYNNPDFLKFYTDLQKLQQAGAFSPDVANQTYNQAVSSYEAGKAAFLDAGVWAAGSIQTSSVGSDTGYWAGPHFTDGVGNQNIVMNVYGAPLSFSASLKPGTAKYDAVEKFIGFYYSDAGQQIFADNGQSPVTTYSPKVPAKDTVFQAVLNAAKGLPAPVNQPDLYLSTASQNAMYDSIYGVIEGQLAPQAAIQQVAASIVANK